jgi:predicted amidohydrolase
MSHFRVATLQYFLRPVATFDDFEDQVNALIETAADYHARLVVFPEYFSVQLLTLGDVKRPIADQVRELADQSDRVTELLSAAARRHEIHIVGGTVPVRHGRELHNECRVFAPDGRWEVQAKLHMTRFEREEWFVAPGGGLKVFETSWGNFAVAICYDAEFPEIARAAALQGAEVLVVPSCTDDRQGFLRVRYCAHARAIENQMYVITSSTVGSLPMVPAVHLNYGQAAILTPSDFAFARDGILAEGNVNQEMMVIGDLDLEYLRASRTRGTVLPLRDSASTSTVLGNTQVVAL